MTSLEENMAENKRPNFSTAERMFILDLVGKYWSIIDDKRTDTPSNRKTEAWWYMIGEAYNKHFTYTPRSWKQLRRCYQNMRSIARREHADDNLGKKTMGAACVSKVTFVSKRVGQMCQDFKSRKPENRNTFIVASDVIEESLSAGENQEMQLKVEDNLPEMDEDYPLGINEWRLHEIESGSNPMSDLDQTACNARPSSAITKQFSTVATNTSVQAMTINEVRLMHMEEVEHNLRMSHMRTEHDLRVRLLEAQLKQVEAVCTLLSIKLRCQE